MRRLFRCTWASSRDSRERVPSSKRHGRDQKSRNDEEPMNAKLAVPDQEMRELFGQEFEIWDLCAEPTDVDVIHQDEENRQATEQVDPVQAFPSCCLICRIRRSHGSFHSGLEIDRANHGMRSELITLNNERDTKDVRLRTEAATRAAGGPCRPGVRLGGSPSSWRRRGRRRGVWRGRLFCGI